MKSPLKLLFLCTGNSSRSIIAEFAARKLGADRFMVFSAGSQPKGNVNPLALRIIREEFGMECAEARSKSWSEFEQVQFDFVITLCSSAHESCPIWPGQPTLANWEFADPEAFNGSQTEQLQFFRMVANQIYYRIDLLCSLPIEHMMVNRLKLAQSVRELGRSDVKG